ncbi:unnamed protein product [Nippostrongylus brasiliensis]|uniref:Monocarboxylate transporter n=1 Tax=Nippostrongylus brasiliensis TaxID=27835 RepID=A0A0N4YZN8_NIPBR|nr:unnamed protein product [Nippostrongylus brasiliensis]
MNEKQDSKSNGNTASSYPHKVVNDEYGSNKSRSNSQESNSPSGSVDKVEEKSDDADLGVPPIDTCHLAFAIVLLNGIGVLLPWNMFITIAPNYYVEYWFTVDGNKTSYAKSFMSALGITAQLPNFLMSLINVMQIIG